MYLPRIKEHIFILQLISQREGLRTQNVNQSHMVENNLKVASLAKSLRENTQGT